MTGVVPGAGFVEFQADEIEQSIAQRFEQQVDLHPDRLAVRMGAVELTYAELDEWANQVAGSLLARTGAEQEAVGLVFEQGVASIAAILGVLKAGKFYVPLDPSHPPAVLARMLDWVGAEVVLTELASAGLSGSLTDGRRELLVVDRLDDSAGAGRPAVDVSADAIAYVFFTSGSTGAPKGVYDSQRNVLHNILRYTNALMIGSHDRVTLLQSPAYSGSISSLFSALLDGGAVFPFRVAEDGPHRLADLLLDERLTIYHSVPAIFRSVLHGRGRFSDLRVIRLEGDRASSHDVDLCRRHFEPTCILANGLGTTETGLCRQYLIDADTVVPDGILPVGYPVKDMEVVILDDGGAEVEPGQTGEIAVRSRYLASGYWLRPDLTDLAFGGDPDGGPERRYRTGDLGRLQDDGCLEYLSRKDFQLKVRGHRIDSAEVESTLIAVAGVRDAVVTTRENARGDAELVAYLTSATDAPVDPGVLRDELALALPRHLIPTHFVWLEELPLSDNGKVDRRALPAPEELTRTRSATPPRDPLERQLIQIWQDVLGIQPIGIDDRFADLGGDSLAAAVIVARVENETSSDLTPSAFLEHSTVASLAEALRTHRARPGSPLVAINPHGSLPALFLVHDLVGEVSRYDALAHRLGDDQPVWGIRCTSDPDTIELMASRYVTEIRRIQPSGPYRLGGWCFGAVIAFEMAKQLRASHEQVALLTLIGISAWDFPTLVAPGAWRRFQLASGPGQMARVRYHLAVVGDLGLREGARYVARKSARLIRNVNARTAQRPVGDPPVPRSYDARGVMSRSKEAFAGYLATPFPGRPVLILSREETAVYSRDPTSDWRRIGTDGAEVRELAGYHDAILAEPHVGELARQLGELLAAANREAPPATSERLPETTVLPGSQVAR